MQSSGLDNNLLLHLSIQFYMAVFAQVQDGVNALGALWKQCWREEKIWGKVESLGLARPRMQKQSCEGKDQYGWLKRKICK